MRDLFSAKSFLSARYRARRERAQSVAVILTAISQGVGRALD
jgi:hypothetical protein